MEATALLSTLGTPLFRVYSYLRVLPLRPCFYRATAALLEEQTTDAFALFTFNNDNPESASRPSFRAVQALLRPLISTRPITVPPFLRRRWLYTIFSASASTPATCLSPLERPPCRDLTHEQKLGQQSRQVNSIGPSLLQPQSRSTDCSSTRHYLRRSRVYDP
jgi:hypothetical protein